MTDAINAGTLEIQLMADVARLRTDVAQGVGIVTRGADQMRQAAMVAQNALGTIGMGLSAAGFAAFVKTAIDTLDALDDLAEKTGIAADQLAVLRYAGEVAGTPLESLAKGVQKLTLNMAAAAGGGKEQAAAFGAINVRVRELDGSLRSSDAVLADVADRFASFRDGPEKAALAVELFGKSGAEMIPLLNRGSAGIAELRSEAQRLGVTIDSEAAAAAGAFNDNLTRLRLSAEATGTTIASALLPTLNDLTAAMLESQEGSGGMASAIGGGLNTVLQAASVLGINVGFVIKGVGREAGAIAAQMAALARLDIDGFTAISDAVKEDGARARRELDDLERRILGLPIVGAGRGTAADPRALGAVPSIGEQTRGWKPAGPAPDKKDDSNKTGAPKESDYDRLIKKINTDLTRALADAEGAQRGYTRAQVEFLALAASPEWGTFTALQRANIAAKFEQRIATEQLRASEDAALKAAVSAAEARQSAAQKEADSIAQVMAAQQAAYSASLASVNDRLQQLQDEEAAARLMAGTNLSLAEAVEMVAQARLREKQAGFVEGSEGYLAIERELEARRKLLAAISSSETRKASEKSAQEAKDAWQRATDQIGQSLTDALMTGGKSGAEYIESLFRTMVLRPVVQYGVNSLMSAIGLGGPAQPGGLGGLGLLGTVGNVGGLGNVISGVGDIASMAGLGSLLSSSAAYGAAIGTTAVGAGSQAAMLASQTGVFGASGTAATASAAGGLGGALVTAAPYLAALAVVSSLFKDDSGTYHTGAGSTYSAAGGLAAPTVGADGWMAGLPGMASTVYSADTAATTDTLVKSIVGVLDATALTFGKTAGYTAATAFADDTSKDGAWGALTISKMGEAVVDWADGQTSRWAPKEFADGQAGQAQYTAAVAASVRDTLTAMDLPGWAAAQLDALGKAPTLEALSGALTQIQATQDALQRLSGVMPQLAGLTDATTTSLLGLMGGTNGLLAMEDQYYQRFHSEQERMDTLAAQLTGTLDSLGLAMPEGIKEFRALVEAQDLSTAAGVANYATLIKSQDAFYTLDQYAAKQAESTLAAAAAAAKQADALDKVTKSTHDIIAALQEQSRANASSLFDYQRAFARARLDIGAASGATATAAAAPTLFETAATSAAVLTPTTSSSTAAADTSAATVAAVNALRSDFKAQVDGLRAEVRAVVASSAETARTLDRVSRGTNSVYTTAA
jgi:hypothetical protein